jgi:hypothetical protein
LARVREAVTKTQSAARQERLAAALRANLKRRKAKDRALAKPGEDQSRNPPPERPKSGAKPR